MLMGIQGTKSAIDGYIVEVDTLKSMLPLPSLSNILKIWSTKTAALPAGRIMEYMSSTCVLSRIPSGQSAFVRDSYVDEFLPLA